MTTLAILEKVWAGFWHFNCLYLGVLLLLAITFLVAKERIVVNIGKALVSHLSLQIIGSACVLYVSTNTTLAIEEHPEEAAVLMIVLSAVCVGAYFTTQMLAHELLDDNSLYSKFVDQRLQVARNSTSKSKRREYRILSLDIFTHLCFFSLWAELGLICVIAIISAVLAFCYYGASLVVRVLHVAFSPAS